MDKSNGSVTKDDGGVTDEQFLFTYDDNERQENEINKENAKLVFSPEFIPYYISVKRQYNLTESEILLYGFIRFYLSTNPKGRFYFSNKQLGDILGFAEGTIANSIKKLKDLGIINPKYKIKSGGGQIRFINGDELNFPMRHDFTRKLSPSSLGSEGNNNKINNNKINVTKVTQNEYGNPSINKILSHLKETLNLPKLDQSVKVNRRYAKLLLEKSEGNLEGVLSLIDLTATDDWFKNNITSTKDLYYKAIKIMARKRGKQNGNRIADFTQQNFSTE